MELFPTGYSGKNKQGLEYDVLDGTLAKKIQIKFRIDGVELVTTRAYLKVGLPMHPTYGKMLPGQIFRNKKGLEFELLEKVGVASWKIRFLKDGAECTRETSSIKSGSTKHPTDGVPVIGNRYEVNAGWITVVDVKSAIDVTVQFDDGVIQKTTSADIRTKNVGHPTSGLHIGQKFKTNSGWVGEIIDYKSCYEVGVKWQDGSIEYHPAGHIKNGGIKPLYQPSVADVGYMGEGRFSSCLKNKGEKAPDVIYAYWQRMLVRTFNPEEILKNSGRRYLFVNVHKDWFNFQNFAEWALTQPNWDMGHDLDKDLIGSGFEYSAENCTFLPSAINAFLAENWAKSVHDLPIGVQYIKPATVGAKEGYVSRCHNEKGRDYLGYFDCPMEAHYAYKKAKEAYSIVLAEKFKEVITKPAYERLINYKLTEMYPLPAHNCGD